MVAGHLREKSGYYYAVLNYTDSLGKRKTKWISTGLTVKGNKKRAEAILMCTCQEKVDTKKGKITGSPVRSCTELGFCSPRQQPDGDD